MAFDTNNDGKSQNYENPIIAQIQTITKTISTVNIPQLDGGIQHQKLIKGLKNSRNSEIRLGNYNSAQNLRKIRTSQSRFGNLTSRESGFRPTTGLGLATESTVG
jgi:hypothetical protein